MADFRANIAVDIDDSQISAAEQRLKELEKDRKVKISVELDKSAEMQAKDLTTSIERGIKNTKLDTGNLARQLADGFNVKDKGIISKLKGQMDSMLSHLGKTWDGKRFDFGKASGFYSGIDKMAETVSKNAKIIQGKMGIYDQFADYFKGKKIYISDALKNSMGNDLYKEISSANIGKIVRDATKGVSIDSLWSEMTNLFPEHFSKDITNQVDQVVRAFDVLKAARADVAKTLSFDDMSSKQRFDISEDAYSQLVPLAHKMSDSLQQNITAAADNLKTEFEIDVKVNTANIISDIQNALNQAATSGGEGIKINLDLNKSEIENQIRNAIQAISANDNPLKIKIDIDKQSIEGDIRAALNDIDLPIQFRVDAGELESQIRSAIAAINDVVLDVRVNTDQIQNDIRQQLDASAVNIPNVDNGNAQALYSTLGNINNQAAHGQSVFQAFGATLNEAFATFTLANLLEDAIYKVIDTGKKAFDTVKEINSAAVDLQMATGGSYVNVKNMMDGYNALGQELGALTTEISSSADAWLRQGKTAADTNTLIKDSLVLSKVGQLSGADATEYLTSAMQGYKIEVEGVANVIDKLTAIDLASATDAGGLAEAMSRTANSANLAGVSMDRLLGMLATTGEVTQKSMSSIGESYKTIFARMRDIKTGNLEFVGDDGQIEDLSNVEIVLDALGIKLRDSNQEFRNFQNVLDEVAAGWENYSSVQQAAIAKAFSGQRQQENFIAMMENYDKVLKYSSLAGNSDGTALEKFGYYTESIEAKTKSLQASLESLATSTISDSFYSGLLDGAKAMTDFVTQTNLLKGALAGLGSAGALFAFQNLGSWMSGAVQEFSNLTAALNLLKNVNIIDDTGLSNLISLTRGLTNSQLQLVLSSNTLTTAQRMAILTSRGLSDAEASATLATMGLANAQNAGAAATVTFSGAIRGLWASLMANPLVLVAAGVTAAVAAFSAYKQGIAEAVSAAKEAGTAFSDNTTSLDEQKVKVQELRDTLASGTLSEQEAYDAKSQLLSIQQSLTETYGEQASGIDLVNGSLETQIELMGKLSKVEADRFLNENQKGINEAKKAMENHEHSYLGSASLYSDEGKRIAEIANKYKDVGLYLQNDESTGEYTIHFNGDASQAQEVLNNFASDVRNLQNEVGETPITDDIISYTSSELASRNKVLEEYQDFYKQIMSAEMLSKGTGQGSIADTFNEYARAIEEYNKAVLNVEDTERLEKAKSNFETVAADVKQILQTEDGQQFASMFEEIESQLNRSAIAANDFREAVTNGGKNGYQKWIKNTADELKRLEMSDIDFLGAFNTDGIQEGEGAVNALADAALRAGVISDTSSGQIQSLVDILVNAGVLSTTAAVGVDALTKSYEAASSTANDLLQSITYVNSVLDSQSTGKSISIDDFNSDELADYTSALEYNNGTLQLNAEKVKELQEAKAKEAIQTNDNIKLEKQSQYMQNIAEIERLQDQLRGLTDAKSDNANAIQASIDSLLSENDAIVSECTQLDLLSASLREATGAYQAWLDSQNAGESGDMFDDALGAMEQINSVTTDTESEDYGKVGLKRYKAAVDFIIPDSVDSTDSSAVKSYMDSIGNYFTYDEDGGKAGLNIEEFCQQAMSKGLMVLDEESQQYKVAGQRTMEDFAEGLNLSLPMVQAMFGEMEEYGAEFDWSDEAIKTLGDLGMAAGEAKSRIEELSGNENLDIQIDVSDIESTEDKISTLDSTIAQMQGLKARPEIDSSSINDANAIIQYCITQKQMLEAPAVMSVDASSVEGELSNAISLLQEFQAAQNTQELQASVGADTSEAEAKVDSLVGEIQGLSPEIQAKLQVDATSAETIATSIEGLTPEILVKAGVDPSEVEAYQNQKHDSSGTVKWGNDTSTVDSWASQLHRSNGTVYWGNDTSNVRTIFTATGTVNWTNASGPKVSGASGTAHANGTAYPHLVGYANANGNWGTKTSGVALVGELGREIVVDPRNGTWQTVGDNGAEFKYIPAGSIVFNHKQAEALLERGFVNSRGHAYASGTSMVTGGISISQANKRPSNTYTSSSSSAANSMSNAANSMSSAATSVKKAASSLDDVTKNLKDWFEIKVSKMQSQIELYEKKADNAYGLSTKNNYIQKAIDVNNALMKNYQQAKKAYKSQANSIAKEVGLSDPLRKKVEDGSIEFTKLSDDDKKRVEAYQKWYEKIRDCDSALEDLKAKQKELSMQKLTNVTDKYDNLRSTYIGRIDVLQSKKDFRTANGNSILGGSATTKAIEEQKKLQDDISRMYESEIAAYKKQMNQIAKTYGKKSKEYKDALAGLRGLEAALWDSKKAAAEYAHELRDNRLQLKDWQIEKFQRSSDKLEAYRNFKEATNYKNSKRGAINEQDYKEAIKTNDRTIRALNSKRDELLYDMGSESYNSKEYRQLAEQLAAVDKEIMNLAASTAEFKQAIVEIRFQPFYDAKDTLEELTTDYETLMGMMDSESFFNDDAKFSEYGMANIALLSKAMDAEKQKIANFRAQLKNIQEEYDNGNITEAKYKEYTKEITEGIRQSSQAMYQYNENMLDMYEQQITKENELLQTNITKRTEAIDKKKEYYDYDRTIKKKSKDINALKAQIAALEGTSNAASRSRLEKLKAELAEAEDDMDDTVYQHETEMKKYGYDQLSKEANTALSNTISALKKNTDMQQSIINGMLTNVTNSYEGAYGKIQQIIKDTGLMVSEAFDKYINAGTSLDNKHVNDFVGDNSITDMDNSHIAGGDGSGNGKVDDIINDVADQNSTSNGSSHTFDGEDWAKSVTLSKSSVTMGVNQSATIKVTVSPADAPNKDILCTATKAKIVKITTGVEVVTVKALAVGTTTLKIKADSPYCKEKKCTVYVLKNYKANKAELDNYLSKSNQTLSDSEKDAILRDAENAPSIGFGGSAAVDFAKKKLLQNWYNGLKARPEGTNNVSNNVSALAKYFLKKGKSVNRYDLQKLADILGIKTPGAAAYDNWGSTLKNKILNEYKNFGFSKGGYVDKGRYMSMNTLSELDNYYRSKGEHGLAWVQQGEDILNKQLTRLMTSVLPTTINTMEEFNGLDTELLKEAVNNITDMRKNTRNENSYTSNVENMIRIDGNVDKYVFRDIRTLANDLGKYFAKDAKKTW